MGNYKWTEGAVAAFQKRSSGWKKTEQGVTTHLMERPVSSRRSHNRSDLEGQLKLQLLADKRKDFVQQYQPLPPRKWTLDFAFPDLKLAIEVQGMVHRIKDKFRRDIEKRAELMLSGWKVLEVDGESIRDGRALDWVRRLLR